MADRNTAVEDSMTTYNVNIQVKPVSYHVILSSAMSVIACGLSFIFKYLYLSCICVSTHSLYGFPVTGC